MARPLPIGVEDFELLINEDYYFVDKTLLIKELIDAKGMVSLFTRPRHFGKTLSMSMLKYFYEIPIIKETYNDTKRHLFENLKIWQAGEKYRTEQGKYPVISITLKNIEGNSWQQANRYCCNIHSTKTYCRAKNMEKL